MSIVPPDVLQTLHLEAYSSPPKTTPKFTLQRVAPLQVTTGLKNAIRPANRFIGHLPDVPLPEGKAVRDVSRIISSTPLLTFHSFGCRFRPLRALVKGSHGTNRRTAPYRWKPTHLSPITFWHTFGDFRSHITVGNGVKHRKHRSSARGSADSLNWKWVLVVVLSVLLLSFGILHINKTL